MKKYILAVILMGVLLLSTLLISNGMKNNEAKSAYKEAQQRCGHDPLVFGSSGTDTGTQHGTIYIGSSTPQPGEKYFCSLTDAVNHGYIRSILNDEASDEIKKLYP